MTKRYEGVYDASFLDLIWTLCPSPLRATPDRPDTENQQLRLPLTTPEAPHQLEVGV
jgi:hypothetical protein